MHIQIAFKMKQRFFLNFKALFTLIFCVSMVACQKGKDKPTVMPPVKVTVMEVNPGLKEAGMDFSGTVSSAETTTVSFAVAGTITELYAKEGQKVSKGQLLGKLRNGEYLNAYNIAEAQLAEAEDGYQRLKKLHDANALPEVKWVEINQKLKEAQNMAEMAKRTLDDASLHSPASGTITRKFADVGQTVMPVEPVYEVVSTNDLTIDIPVSESQISDFNIGDKATVDIQAAGLTRLQGKVSQKTVTADPLTRSFTVKVAIPNTDGKILPGMIGNVTFTDLQPRDTISRTITLPSQAVLLDSDNRWFVWVVNDSVTQRRFVEADELVANGVVVNSGLREGDKVVVEGMQKVGTGTRVIY